MWSVISDEGHVVLYPVLTEDRCVCDSTGFQAGTLPVSCQQRAHRCNLMLQNVNVSLPLTETVASGSVARSMKQ